MSARVVLVDDHELVRAGIRSLLLEAGYQVIAEGSDGDQVEDRVLHRQDRWPAARMRSRERILHSPDVDPAGTPVAAQPPSGVIGWQPCSGCRTGSPR